MAAFAAITQVVKDLGELSTATISDAMDRLGIAGAMHGIQGIGPGMRMAGTAFTLRYIPVGAVPGNVGDYVDDAQPGDVIVIDNRGRTDCTVWGDLLTMTAQQRGLAGTVIDGVCRDVDRIQSLGYPMFTRGRYMVTGKGRVQLDALQVPVTIGQVQVCPGDVLVGDGSGVLCIPRAQAAAVLATAQSVQAAEAAILKDVLAGLPLREARSRHHYHSLQAREQ